MAEIGIKLADGSFFPILDDTSTARKRVVLTAAREDQHNVQVDLIKKAGEVVEHVGFLLLEDLPDDGSQTLEFTLVVGITSDGDVDAQISTSDESQYQSLAVNINQLDGSSAFDLPDVESGLDIAEDLGDIDIPDFDLDSDDIDAADFEESVADAPFSGDSYTDEFAESYSDAGFDEPFEEEPRRFNFLAIIAVLLIVLSLIALATFGVFQLLKGDAPPELRSILFLPAVPAIPRRWFRKRQ